MKGFEQKNIISVETNDGKTQEKKSIEHKSPDSGRKESFFNKVKNKAMEVRRNFNGSIDGMKKNLKDRSSSQFENEEKEFETEMAAISKEGDEATKKFESDLEDANAESGAKNGESGGKKEAVAEKKEDSREIALQLAKQLLEARHKITEEMLSGRNENGSVNLGDFNVSKEEADELLNKSSRMRDEIVGSVNREIEAINEKELETVIAGLKTENDSVSQESIAVNIKDSITEKRTHERISESKNEAIKTLKKVENKLGEIMGELISAGKTDKAVTIREFEREIDLLKSKIELAPIGSVEIRGRSSMQEHDKNFSKRNEVTTVKLEEIGSILKLVSKESSDEDFSNSSQKIKEILESIKDII
jgi:hypothetical protein